MTWIKICGITNSEDAQTAAQAGADALGFVFYEKSPRRMDADAAVRAANGLPESVERVGVFVDHAVDSVAAIAKRAGLTGVQLYSGTAIEEAQIKALPGLVVYLAIPAEESTNGLLAKDDKVRRSVRAVLLDSGRLRSGENPGGTGKTFDWQKAVPVAENIRSHGFRLVVAGGLAPANVAEAIRVLQPWGVDVSTGVESRPGKKDADKIRAFVAAVRQAE